MKARAVGKRAGQIVPEGKEPRYRRRRQGIKKEVGRARKDACTPTLGHEPRPRSGRDVTPLPKER
jgi:hypothetical protein